MFVNVSYCCFISCHICCSLCGKYPVLKCWESFCSCYFDKVSLVKKNKTIKIKNWIKKEKTRLLYQWLKQEQKIKNKKILQLLLCLRDCAQWDFITHFFHAFFLKLSLQLCFSLGASWAGEFNCLLYLTRSNSNCTVMSIHSAHSVAPPTVTVALTLVDTLLNEWPQVSQTRDQTTIKMKEINTVLLWQLELSCCQGSKCRLDKIGKWASYRREECTFREDELKRWNTFITS